MSQHMDRRLRGYVSDEQLLRALKRTEDLLGQAGIRPAASSRLIHYKKTLQRRMRSANWRNTDADFERTVLYIYQLERIVEMITEVGSHPETPGWRDKVEAMLRGGPLPESIYQSSLARDTEFEVSLAAWLKRVGLAPEFKEPDIVLLDTDGPWAVSAKRPSSRKRLAKTIRKAASQIQMSGLDGIIAVEISKLIKADRTLSVYQTSSSHLAKVEQVANEFVRDNISAIRASTGTPAVFGVAVILETPCLFLSNREVGYSRRIVMSNLVDPRDARCGRMARLASKMAD